MAQASRRERKIRRMKRERSLAYKLFYQAAAQRDFLSNLLQEQAKKLREQTIQNGDLEITKVEEENPEVG